MRAWTSGRSAGFAYLVLAAGAVVLGGCSGDPSYGVRVEFDPPSLQDRIDRVFVSLVDSCPMGDALGQPVHSVHKQVALEATDQSGSFGEVEEGLYGVYAIGRGACVGAVGCAPARVTGDETTFEVLLEEVSLSRIDGEGHENGGCGNEATCTEDNGEPVCTCLQEGHVFNGAQCAPPGQVETFLSDWAWSSETNRHGAIERDRSNNGDEHGDGNPMHVDGTRYQKGLGVSAPSELRANLDGRCSRFEALIGMDDEASNSREALAEAWVDDVRVYRSGEITKDSAPEEVDVSLEGGAELRLVTSDPNAGSGSAAPDSIDWVNARVVCEEGWRGAAVESFASDWSWFSQSNGFGPAEHDESNGAGEAGDGATISLNGDPYTKGIGVHAPSDITIDIAEHCWRFRTDVGIDDEVTTGGSAVFQIWADNEMLYESDTVTSSTATSNVSVDLAGRLELRLVVLDAGDGTDGDHADWANAKLLCASGWQGGAVETYVSDWVFNVANNNDGPIERDTDAGGAPAHDGGPLEIDGEMYTKGIGTLAPSQLALDLGGRCTTFRADVGVDDSASEGGADIDVRFLVLADGHMLFDSSIMRLGDPAQPVEIDVTGRSSLVLETNQQGDLDDWDLANWANARLSCEVGAFGLP